ncbi:MAG TPA: discoidin domain-containing protein, partial [Candidatus Goldiibacteriota bacterium]|nr:discoidin domain-containing protein [Candidatus Goldiibacteriota bacterium]
ASGGNATAPGGEDDLLAGLDTATADTKQTEPEKAKKRDAEPQKSVGPETKKAITKTNDIYTKSSYIGGYRHLREIMSWGIKATSSLSEENGPEMIVDNIIDTAWVEGKKDGGKKQAITFDFAEKYFIGLFEQKYRKAEIRQFKILNGYAADKETWKKHFRVKKMKITKNKKLLFYVMLRDTMNWQTITMKKPLIVSPGDVIKAEIMEVYPEVRREDDTYTAITEFNFIGGPYGEQVLPKYIQAHMQ